MIILFSLVMDVYDMYRLKKIQKKKAAKRALKEKEIAELKATGQLETNSVNNLIYDDRDDDLLFEN